MALPPNLRKAHQADMPPINDMFKEGLGYREVSNIAQYISSYLHGLKDSWVPGFTYLDFRPLTPEESIYGVDGDHESIQKPKRQIVEITESTITGYVFRFQYNNEPIINRTLILPYSRPYSEFIMNSSRWFFAPVVADSIISVKSGYNDDPGEVFVRLETARLTFRKDRHTFSKDGYFESASLVHSVIHNETDRSSDIAAKHTIVHYLLAKYGYTEMFRRYVGFVPVVGNSLTVSPENYPSENWHIFANIKTAAATTKKTRAGFIPSDIAIAVPKEQCTDKMRLFIAGVLYVVNFFDDARPENFDMLAMWRIYLGAIIYGLGSSPERLNANMVMHIQSIDLYLESMSKERLKKLNYHCENFYDLIALIAVNFDTWIYEKSEFTPVGKEISVVRWVAGPWIQAINRMTIDMQQAKARDKQITRSMLVNLLKRHLHTKLVFQLIAGTHGEMINLQFSGDNGICGASIATTPQRSVHASQGSGKKINPDAPDQVMTAERPFVYSCMAMTKPAPGGDTRLSPHIRVEHGIITLSEEARQAIPYLRKTLVRPFGIKLSAPPDDEPVDVGDEDIETGE